MPTKFEYEFYIFTDRGTTTDTVEGYSGAVAQELMERRYPGIKVVLKNMRQVEDKT